jgi:hypothetical protein
MSFVFVIGVLALIVVVAVIADDALSCSRPRGRR